MNIDFLHKSKEEVTNIDKAELSRRKNIVVKKMLLKCIIIDEALRYGFRVSVNIGKKRN